MNASTWHGLRGRLVATALAVAFLGLAPGASAELIGGYSFSNFLASSASPAPPNGQQDKIVFGDFTRGTGLTLGSEGGTNYIKAAGWAGAIDFPTAATNGHYFAFTVTPWVACSMTITQMTFNEGGTSSGPTTWGVTTSLEDFTNAVGTGPRGGVLGAPGSRNLPPINARSVTFGPAYAGVDEALEIRIPAWGTGSDGGFWTVDEVMLYGSLEGNVEFTSGTYSLTGATPASTTSYPVDAQPSSATFSDLRRGPGLGPSTHSGSDFMSAASWTQGVDYASAVAAGDYYGFTVTVAKAESIYLERLRFDEIGSSTAPSYWGVGTSLDGFAAAVGWGTTYKVTGPPPGRTRTNDFGVTFHGLTGSLEIRIAGWTCTNPGAFWSIDNIILDYGFIPLPRGTVLTLR